MAEEQNKTSGKRSGRPRLPVEEKRARGTLRPSRERSYATGLPEAKHGRSGRSRLPDEEKIRRGTFRRARARIEAEDKVALHWRDRQKLRAAEERAAAEAAAAALPASSFFCWHCRRRKAQWDGKCCYPALQGKKQCDRCGRGCAGKRCQICRSLDAEARPPQRFVCRNCRQPFERPSAQNPAKQIVRKFCSKTCRQSALAELMVSRRIDPTRKAEARRFREKIYGQKRRAAGWKPVKGRWRTICERDGWLCWLCGERIDPSLSNPHPLSGSADHVLPLSKGGTDKDENCRAAHLRCNCRRGNESRVQNAN